MVNTGVALTRFKRSKVKVMGYKVGRSLSPCTAKIFAYKNEKKRSEETQTQRWLQ